jgi:hypothetical protein
MKPGIARLLNEKRGVVSALVQAVIERRKQRSRNMC